MLKSLPFAKHMSLCFSPPAPPESPREVSRVHECLWLALAFPLARGEIREVGAATRAPPGKSLRGGGGPPWALPAVLLWAGRGTPPTSPDKCGHRQP